MGTHVYLCGRLAIVGGDDIIDERALPGRQGRLAFALLCLDRRHPVAIDRLVQTVGDDDPPPDAAGVLRVGRQQAAHHPAPLSMGSDPT